jgi:hypothetical protein
MLRILLRRAVIGLVLLALPTIAFSQSITVNAVIGFNGVVKLGAWNPVIVEIENAGPTGEFIVSVEVQKGTSYRTNRTLRFEANFTLAGSDRKRFDFTVPIESSGLPVFVRVHRDGLLIAEESYPVLGNVTRVPLVVALSRSAAFDFLIPDAMVTYPHPELMPMRWDAYFAADIVILHDAELARLSPAHVEALTEWVDRGGTVLIAGGAHLPRLPSVLAPFGEVKIAGIRKISGYELISRMSPGLPGMDGTDGDAPISNFVGGDASEVMRFGDVVIAGRFRRGAGSLVFAGFDFGSHPFNSATSKREAWEAIGIQFSTAELDTKVNRVFENPMASISLTTANTGPPDRLIFLIGGTLYVMLIVFLLRYLSKAPRSPSRWLIVTGAVLAALVLSYVSFSKHLFEPAYLSSVTSIARYRPGAAHAVVSTDYISISTSRGTRSVSIDDDRVIVLPRTRNSLVLTRDEGKTEFVAEHAHPWTHDAFRIESMIPLHLDAKLDATPEHLGVRLENQTDLFILGSVFLYRGIVYPAGPFAPGDILERTFRRSTAPVENSLAAAVSENGTTNLDTEPVRRALLTQLISDESWREIQERDGVIFVGWIMDPLVRFSADPPFQHEVCSQALVVILEPETELHV